MIRAPVAKWVSGDGPAENLVTANTREPHAGIDSFAAGAAISSR